MDASDGPAPSAARMRLDKWLWAARFYRTRTLAAQAIDAGQVRIGEARVKPAHALRAGDRVLLRKSGQSWDVAVLALSDRRGSAADAAKLYAETPESLAARKEAILARNTAYAAGLRSAGRPTKRDRRRLEDFLNEP